MKYLVVIALISTPFVGLAQEVHQELQETVRAEVIKILDEEERDIAGTGATTVVQEVLIEVKGGLREGEKVSFFTDLMPLEVGDNIYVNRLVGIDGVEYFDFKDVDRSFSLVSLGLLFAVLLVVFAGKHGVRSLASLALSVFILFFVLVPLLLEGHSPVLVSVAVAGPVLAAMLLLTHGLNSRTYIAFFGTFGAIILTSLLALVWVASARFTGLTDDAAIYLNFSTKGTLDFSGLLLGSILIGILGVLDDVAITQASVVGELKHANGTLSFKELYVRALRVGRDHIGSLVNTLSFAYIGVALPLVLLLVKAESDLVMSLNQERVAVELVRILIGTIGLILAVPLTTLIAAWWYERYPSHIDESQGHTHRH